MKSGRHLLLLLALAPAVAEAQATAPPAPVPAAPTPAERAAKRFPQPVRVGDLIGRQVLRPTETQSVLGRVAAITRRADGGIDVVVRFGGVLGLGTRLIAVPVEAVALLGEHVVAMDLTPEALQALPTVDGRGAGPLAPDEFIRVGLTKPSH